MPLGPHELEQYTTSAPFALTQTAGEIYRIYAVRRGFKVTGWGFELFSPYDPGTTDAVLQLRRGNKSGTETTMDTITVSAANVSAGANRARGQVLQDDLQGEGNEFDVLQGEYVAVRLNTAQVGGTGSVIPAHEYCWLEIPINKNLEKVEVDS